MGLESASPLAVVGQGVFNLEAVPGTTAPGDAVSASLVQRYALLPDEIDRESLQMVQASLPKNISLSPKEHYVLCRIVRAEGDPGIAADVRFSPGAVELGLQALKSGAEIITGSPWARIGKSPGSNRPGGF